MLVWQDVLLAVVVPQDLQVCYDGIENDKLSVTNDKIEQVKSLIQHLDRHASQHVNTRPAEILFGEGIYEFKAHHSNSNKQLESAPGFK